MKKTVEMTYCDRCSTEIAPDVLESYEGFDLCRTLKGSILTGHSTGTNWEVEENENYQA